MNFSFQKKYINRTNLHDRETRKKSYINQTKKKRKTLRIIN